MLLRKPRLPAPPVASSLIELESRLPLHNWLDGELTETHNQPEHSLTPEGIDAALPSIPCQP